METAEVKHTSGRNSIKKSHCWQNGSNHLTPPVQSQTLPRPRRWIHGELRSWSKENNQIQNGDVGVIEIIFYKNNDILLFSCILKILATR